MKIEKIIIDQQIYGGRYDAADIVVDVELQEGLHYAYNFVAKSHCETNAHPNKKHTDECFRSEIEKKMGNITAKILMYEHKMMDNLKR